MLIALEGLDRSGKTSQCRLLEKRLKEAKIPVELIAFPDRSDHLLTGKPIKELLSRPAKEAKEGKTKASKEHDQAVHLLFAANRFEKAAQIREHLKTGKVVLLDRYILSGLAYSTAKGLDRKWCARADHGLPWPDITFYLTLDPEKASQRPGFGSEAFETVAFQSRVAKAYDGAMSTLIRKSWDVAECFHDGIQVITTGDMTIEQVNDRLFEHIMKYLKSKSSDDKATYVEQTFDVEL